MACLSTVRAHLIRLLPEPNAFQAFKSAQVTRDISSPAFDSPLYTASTATPQKNLHDKFPCVLTPTRTSTRSIAFGAINQALTFMLALRKGNKDAPELLRRASWWGRCGISRGEVGDDRWGMCSQMRKRW